ncbi:MAG: peptide ABC transporter substrate-binding protein [Oscillospiraceae bacterium]
MKSFRKALAFLLSAAMSVCVFTGCGDKTENDGEQNSTGESTVSTGESQKEESNKELKLVKEDQVYRFSSGSDVTGLNPITNTTQPDNGLQHLILETLVADVADENDVSTIKPCMAESWDISDDGKVYTFHIRQNAKWSDGVDFTADDIVYTYQVMANPESAATNAWYFDGVIENFKEAHYSGAENGDGTVNPEVAPEEIGVKAIDAKTLEITLIKPTPYFLGLIALPKPIRKDLYEKYGSEYGSSVDKVATNGMFNLVKWDQDIQMDLEKNPTYWDVENVKLERIERKIIKESSTHAQSLLNGDIDVGSSRDPKWINMLDETKSFRTIHLVGSSTEFYTFNCDNKYLKNAKVRQAFSLAIDREKLVEEIWEGKAEPIYSMMSPVTGYNGKFYYDVANHENEAVKTLATENPDPKALLIEGLKELGLDPDPSKVTLSLVSRGTTEFSKKSAEWQKQNIESILGITLEIDLIEWNIMWDRVDAGDYDVATAGWTPDYNDPYGLLSIYHPVNGYFSAKATNWKGEDADKFAKLLDDSELETDPDKRLEMLVEAEKILVGSSAVIAPTTVGSNNSYLANYVKGYHANSVSYVDYSKIYIEK